MFVKAFALYSSGGYKVGENRQRKEVLSAPGSAQGGSLPVRGDRNRVVKKSSLYSFFCYLRKEFSNGNSNIRKS
jgi:hypothetical protein